MKKMRSLFLALIAVLTILGACSNSNDVNQKQTETTKSSEFPVTIKDALDQEVVIEKKPERIISLLPSNTEIAFGLGLGKQIVGVSDFDNYPEEVKEKEKIGGMEFNVEKIISLKPDLVLAHASNANNAKAGLDQIRNAGIDVLVVNDANSFSKVYESIDMIGKATGKTKEATDMINEMKGKVEEIRKKAADIKDDKKVKVFVEVSPAPDIFTTGKGTFMNEMLEIINAENAAADQEGWVQITEEAIIQLNPDVIVTTYGFYEKNPVEKVLSRKGWENVSAIKNKRVYDVNSDTVSRPGPRLVEGLEELASVVYPEVFKK
jgi:iron complex transport system substrate-binding protein